jgi:hypothetical protein
VDLPSAAKRKASARLTWLRANGMVLLRIHLEYEKQIQMKKDAVWLVCIPLRSKEKLDASRPSCRRPIYPLDFDFMKLGKAIGALRKSIHGPPPRSSAGRLKGTVVRLEGVFLASFTKLLMRGQHGLPVSAKRVMSATLQAGLRSLKDTATRRAWGRASRGETVARDMPDGYPIH